MTAAEKKAAKKAANVAAYNARCEALKVQQAKANIARKAGFHGTDTVVIAAYEEAKLLAFVEQHKADKTYGLRLTRFLAGRERVQPAAKVVAHVHRFLAGLAKAA